MDWKWIFLICNKCGAMGGTQGDINDLYHDPMFNPIAQYEQAYYYYRYLCMQMEYKIKSKEYENMCNKNERGQRRIE